MSSAERGKLVEELSLQARIGTTWTVMLHHTIAGKSGINVTDLQCLNVLQLRGPMTPGQLAEAMTLTTGGAITSVIDRLEKAGFVARRRDERDRRRVIVEIAGGEKMARIGARFEPMREAFEKLMEAYTDEELRVLVDFRTRTNAAYPEIIEAVRVLD